MRILFILTNYPGFGGIEKVTQYLTNYLYAKSIDITIVAFGTNAPRLYNEWHKEIPIYYVPKPAEYDSYENFDYIRGLLSNNDFNYVVLQDSYAPIESMFNYIDYPWDEKLIVAEHSSPTYQLKTVNSYFYCNRGWKFFLVRLLKYPLAYARALYQSYKRHRLLLSKCYKYVLLSNAYVSELRKITLNGSMRKVKAITNPLTIPMCDNHLSEKKKQILFVGRFSYAKGIKFLLSIWKQFTINDNEGWNLVLVGDGEERNEIKSLISKERIKNIRIDPPTSNIAAYYDESAIIAMTSIFEGFGLVLTEAMSRGCVPIAFESYSAIYDIIENGNNGILIKPFRINEYVEQLHQLINDPQKLHLMSVSARKTVDRFSVDTIGEQWIKLLNQDH